MQTCGTPSVRRSAPCSPRLRRTRSTGPTTTFREADAARAFCEGGGEIAAATPDQIAALEAATASVATEIASRPGNAAIIAKIISPSGRRLPIRRPSSFAAPRADAAGLASALNGSYRYEITAQDWADAGVTDGRLIGADRGKYGVEVMDGAWRSADRGAPAGAGRLRPRDITSYQADRIS